MLTDVELKEILRDIQLDTDDAFDDDLSTLQDNLSIRIFENKYTDFEIPENIELAIRLAAKEILKACQSTCIVHDAAVIQAVLDHIRKSL